MPLTERSLRQIERTTRQRLCFIESTLSSQFTGQQLQPFGSRRMLRSRGRLANGECAAEKLLRFAVAQTGQESTEAVQPVDQAQVVLPELPRHDVQPATVELLCRRGITFNVTNLIGQVHHGVACDSVLRA